MRELAQFYKALADDTRLRLVRLLMAQREGRTLCVGRLAEELDVTASSVSQHLRILKDLGLVVGERQSYRIHYFIDRQRLRTYQEQAARCLGPAFASPTPPQGDQQEEEMCNGCCHERAECEHPELRPEQGPCTAEQILECHGEVEVHPCEGHQEAPAEEHSS